jgi:ureidoglycolate lyase
MPLNGDMLFFVAPATPPNDPFPAAGVRVFRVPQYTSLIIRPGVWHHAPFIVGEGTLNVLVTLPERTYANDCYVTHLSVNEQIEISFTQ